MHDIATKHDTVMRLSRTVISYQFCYQTAVRNLFILGNVKIFVICVFKEKKLEEKRVRFV